ncbi:MAG: hypothetical protein HY360_20565 [Verrucomicrobia bacterium]|nr:hypothetical protein [Verrucomicrobiota bacterium]
MIARKLLVNTAPPALIGLQRMARKEKSPKESCSVKLPSLAFRLGFTRANSPSGRGCSAWQFYQVFSLSVPG